MSGPQIYPDVDPQNLIDDSNVESVDWAAAGVNIGREKPTDPGDGRSIFEWVIERLSADHAFIYCDDASGEITDFLAVFWQSGRPLLRYVHCKASSEDTLGARVADLYEVCGQAVRTAPWMAPDKILAHVMRRGGRRPERFIRGGLDDLREALINPDALQFELVVVQPGLSRSKRSASVNDLLAAANTYLVAARFMPIKVVCSA